MAGGSAPSPNGWRVLVVDDLDDIREMLDLVLTSGGHDVRTAGARGELDAVLDGWVPDVVVLDLRIPGDSGVDIAHLLARRPDTAGVPVIAVSAARDHEAAAAAGAVLHLVKPFSPWELTAAIDEILGPSATS